MQAPLDVAHVATLKLLVDEGEAEAIALAKELDCEVVLDDLRARKLATKQQVRCVGLLGVILRAKQAGKLGAVRPLIEALQREKFFFSDALVAEAMRLAGE